MKMLRLAQGTEVPCSSCPSLLVSSQGHMRYVNKEFRIPLSPGGSSYLTGWEDNTACSMLEYWMTWDHSQQTI